MLKPEDVAISSDGTMFLLGGGYNSLDLMNGRITPTEEAVRTFHQAMQDRQSTCAEAGIAYRFMIFPNKILILNEIAQEFSPTPIRSLYLSAFTGNDAVLYPLDVLRQVKHSPRTDSHNSHEGRLAQLQMLLDGLVPSIGPVMDQMARHTVMDHNFSGNLAPALTPIPTESVEVQQIPKGARFATNRLTKGFNGIIDIFTNDRAPTDQRLLVFGDSYFRGLMPYLCWFFPVAAFVRTTFFHAEAVRAFQPDILLQGSAEKYLSTFQLDTEAPHFLDYAQMKGRQTDPSSGFVEIFQREFGMPWSTAAPAPPVSRRAHP